MYTEKKDKVAAVFSYLGWVFWIIAFVIRNREDALSKRHLNQGLVLAVAQTAAGILGHFHGISGLVGVVVGCGAVVLSIMGIVSALRESTSPLPVIGDITLI